jgi:uncharacterized protein YbaP (TraB family)
MAFQLSVKVTLLFVLVFFSVFTFAKGPVWKVSNGQNHVLIGGTIHLLSNDDYPLPSAFDWGYKGAPVLVFEIDPDLASSPEAQQAFLRYSTYTDDRTLQQVLDKETYIALNNFLAVRGMSIESFKLMKPSMLSVMLTVIELQRLGLAGMGVDEFYNQKAKRDGKKRRFLETIDDQFNALLAMGKGKENQVIMHTIDELENMSSIMQQTKRAWRSGDNQALIDVALAPWKEAFPSVYTALLVDRNLRWLPQIENFLTTAEVEYILVGALHLAGPDGVLSMLKEKGYTVQKLTSQ